MQVLQDWILTLAGYFYERTADGMLDPLLATAVVFDDEDWLIVA